MKKTIWENKVFEKKMSRAEVIGLLNKIPDDVLVNVYSDKKWRYPRQGDNQQSCTMLDMNFNVEQRPGIVIHIPNKVLEDLQ